MKRRTPAQIERDEAYKAWQREQVRLGQQLSDAVSAYAKFHGRGFEPWFEAWKVKRRVR